MKKINWKFNFKFKKKENTEPKKPKKPLNNKKILFNIFIVVVSCGILLGIGGLIFIKVTIDKAPTFNIADLENVESTRIYDSEGEVIADIGLVSRENVSYESMPQSLIDAFVSVEDSRFFEHNGFDLPRFVKSLIENIKTMSFSQGASTLTMGLIRNVYFTDDSTQTSRVKSLEYKVQQIYLAIKAENELSKKRIFEIYVNRVNFGASSTRGIKGAAEYYFGKEVSELTLSESAYLAGVINAPNYYNAYKNIDAATSRRNTVLSLMLLHGYISQQEYDLAVSIKLEDQLVGVSSLGGKYVAYVNAVVEEVTELTGQDPYTTTMNIYTYMDRETQDTIEAIENGETSIQFPDDLMQVAIVSMDNNTGAVVGIGGGRGDVVAKGFSRATDMYKQPGSSVKPFLSYALAFEYLGWATTQTVEDKPIVYRGTSIQLKDFDGTYKGQVLLTYAVGVSLNIPAYLTLEQVVDTIGTAKVVEYLNALGFTQVTTDNFDLGYAIGGSTFEVTVEQMAAAHSAMINGGNYITPHTVSRIEFTDGSDSYVPTYASVNVISAESAYLATSLMEQNVSVNYHNYMQILQRSYQVYAKTGTTNYDDTFVDYGIPNGAAKDKWMIASTSNYTTAVWIGYDSAVDGESTYISSSKSALNIPGKINSMLLDVLNDPNTTENVTKPDDVVEITHVKGVFPYASPIEGMNSDLIVTGLINRKFLSLVPLTVPTLSSLTSFTASIKSVSGGKVTLTLNWSSYPDASQLSLSDATLDLTTDFYNASTGQTTTVSATGTKLYDPTWVFGVVQYKASVGGNEISSSGSQSEVTIDLPSSGTINVCGYYAYQSGGSKSNEICQDVAVNVSIPSDLDTIDKVKSFMSNYSISDTVWTLTPIAITDLSHVADLGKIASMTPEVRGTSVSLTTLKSTAVDIKYYKLVPATSFSTKTQAETIASQLAIPSGIWTYTGVARTNNTTQALGDIVSVTPSSSDLRTNSISINELRTNAVEIKYYVDVQLPLTASTKVSDIVNFASTYGLTVDTTSLDTNAIVAKITSGGTDYSSANQPYLYNLQSPITITVVTP